MVVVLWFGNFRDRGSWEPMLWQDNDGTTVSRKKKGGRIGLRGVRGTRTPKKTLDNLVKALGETGKAHKTFLQVALCSRTSRPSQSQHPPRKSPMPPKQTVDRDRSCCLDPGLGKTARDALGNSPLLNDQRLALTEEIENLTS